MSKRVLCKFFVHGACLKGDHCEFSHDWSAPANNLCTFYQKGVCTFGSRCRYDHVKVSRPQFSNGSSSANPPRQSVGSSFTAANPPLDTSSSASIAIPTVALELSASSTQFLHPERSPWNEKSADEIGEPNSLDPADRPICSFAAAGVCPRGENCSHLHGDLCSSCGKHCLHPFRPQEREEHMATCEKKQKQIDALKHSQEIECSVCLERVLSKSTAAERKFGLLSECDHPFCISCIRNWRSSSPSSGMDVNSTLRACPICRKVSFFVIPSVIWYSSKEEKSEIVDSYKAKLRSIDCKHFDFGNGSCPFGTSCFYKHKVKPGSYLWRRNCEPDSSYDEVMGGVHVLFNYLYEPHCTMEQELEKIYDDEDTYYEDYDELDYDDYSIRGEMIRQMMNYDDEDGENEHSAGDDVALLYSMMELQSLLSYLSNDDD